MRPPHDNLYTVIFVPHSERPVASLRLRTLHLQIVVLVLTVFFVGLFMLVHHNSRLAANMRELEELREVNQEQRALIRTLAEETTLLREQMILLEELEKQLREMTDILPAELRGETGSSLSREPAILAATIASMRPQASTWTPAPGSNVVSLAPIAQARETAARMTELRTAVEERQDTFEQLRQGIAAVQAEDAARPSGWPAYGHMTSRFGYRNSPWGVGWEFHAGVDIAARRGTPIVATADGVVAFSGWLGLFGNTVILEHGYGYRTLYGHNDKSSVTVGERVIRGQIIAYIGTTGRSTGPHVHYEVHIHGRQVNPAPFLRGQ